MRAHQRVHVSTTSTLSGWEVEEYLGPVVVHTVAGSGFVSDWLASWSDIFGGRSGTYQNQLRSLSDEAIGALRMKAHELRANWVIGLTVDMDEVSGQGKQMFMVTAMGTAVRAVQQRDAVTVSELRGQGASAAASAPAPVGRLTLEAVQSASRRFVLVDAIATGQFRFNEATWATLIEERIGEAAPWVISTLARILATPGAGEERAPAFLQQASMYFDRLGSEDATAALYRALERSAQLGAAVLMLVRELKLRDLGEIRRALHDANAETRRRALQLLSSEQRSFGVEDVEHFEAIARLCEDESVFPAITTLVPANGKGFFGGKDRWMCECKTERVTTQSHCQNPNCARDQWGFRARDLLPVAAATACLAEAALLRRAFAELAASPLSISGSNVDAAFEIEPLTG